LRPKGELAASRPAAREDPRQKEALPMTIVWILIVIILVLLVIALARRVL
jgi:flagellar basal body-associated protein FliL